jgi:hypothetical protein
MKVAQIDESKERHAAHELGGDGKAHVVARQYRDVSDHKQ